MHFCCICQAFIESEINVLKEKIGEPPILIIDLINECTDKLVVRHDAIDKNQERNICIKCTGKLLIYYKASLIMKRIKNDIIVLTEKTKIDLKRDEELFFELDADKSNADEDYIKIEYIDNTDGLFDEMEEEILLEEVPSLLKIDSLDPNVDIMENESTINEIIEIEKLDFANDEFMNGEFVNEDCLNDDCVNDDSNETIEEPSKKLHEQEGFPITCVDCNLDFKTEKKYNTHRRKEHFSGFICDQCGKIFWSHSGFLTHRSTHSNVKEFVCKECGQGFNQKMSLTRHMAWHSGETPFQCEICPKRFVHKVALYKHIKVHKDERNIECQVCGFKFRTNAHLNRHMQTHTGVKPHSCPICGKCFSQAYNMRVHVKEHQQPGSTRRHRLKCKKCTKTFLNQEKYDAHLKETCGK